MTTETKTWRFGPRGPQQNSRAEPCVDPDSALLTLARLLTNAGGVVTDADVRRLERFLDGAG